MKRCIDRCGRLSIPSEYRKELGLEIGDEARIELKDNKIIISKPSDVDVKDILINKLETLNFDYKIKNELIELINEHL